MEFLLLIFVLTYATILLLCFFILRKSEMGGIDLKKIDTEKPSMFDNLDQQSLTELVANMSSVHSNAFEAVARAHPQIEALIDAVVRTLQGGGRVFYLGAGTSGRLGIVDASEVLPTFGMDNTFIGLIAGGDGAIRRAVEHAEDDRNKAKIDLENYFPSSKDFIIGIAASGRTPYVIGALEYAKSSSISTGCIVCSSNSEPAKLADFPIELSTGPEFISGSTRLNAGTATKMVLNMISTISMILMGKVEGNKMVYMTPTNEKLVTRGVTMIREKHPQILEDEAKELLIKYGSVADVETYLQSQGDE